MASDATSIWPLAWLQLHLLRFVVSDLFAGLKHHYLQHESPIPELHVTSVGHWDFDADSRLQHVPADGRSLSTLCYRQQLKAIVAWQLSPQMRVVDVWKFTFDRAGVRPSELH